MPRSAREKQNEIENIKYNGNVYVGDGDEDNGIICQLKTGRAHQWHETPSIYNSNFMQESVKLSFDYFRDVLNLASLKQ